MRSTIVAFEKTTAGGDPTMVSPDNPLPVQGVGYVGVVSFARPANTTAYAAGDVVGVADVNTAANAGSAIHEFTTVGPAGGHIFITGVDLRIDLTAVPSGMTSFRLYLYSAATDAILDNAAWDLSSAGDRSSFRGYIDLGAPVDLGSTLYVQTDQVNKQFKLSPGVTSLFGLLVTNGAYTPASGTVYSMKLRGIAA